MTMFDEAEPLGAEPPARIASYLEEIGDNEGARQFRSAGPGAQSLLSRSLPAYAMTGCSIGYVGEGSAGGLSSIEPANALSADRSLIGTQIKVSLDRFYVHAYPGTGEHKILCEFGGKNQCDGASEEVRFAMTLRARNGSGAAVSGSPIFVGLTIGEDGVSFQGRTIAVENSGDEWLLNALASDSFRSGLSLVASTQPVLKPFIKLTGEAVAATLRQRKNKLVMNFDLGLDFSGTATSAKIRHGSYVVVQGEQPDWDWGGIRLQPGTNTLVRSDDGAALRQNYMILGVSKAHSTLAPTPLNPDPEGPRRKAEARSPKSGSRSG